jgi:hypothetical protein
VRKRDVLAAGLASVHLGSCGNFCDMKNDANKLDGASCKVIGGTHKANLEQSEISQQERQVMFQSPLCTRMDSRSD